MANQAKRIMYGLEYHGTCLTSKIHLEILSIKILLFEKYNTNFKGEVSSLPSIKCSVSECKWNNAVECHAPMIQVDRNGAGNADTSDQTKCETFKMKS